MLWQMSHIYTDGMWLKGDTAGLKVKIGDFWHTDWLEWDRVD